MAATKDEEGDLIKFQHFIKLHREQLITSGIPEYFWESLHRKLSKGILDAGDHFQIVRIEDDSSEEEDGVKVDSGQQNVQKPKWKVIVTNENGIDLGNAQHIYLIDHAWTYRLDMVRGQLQKNPNLLKRMAALMDIDQDQDELLLTEQVLEEMWRYNQTYSAKTPNASIEEEQPVWYVMDEFGSKIQHSEEPTFRAVPLYYAYGLVPYTLLFPVKNVERNGEVTRNFVEGPEVSEPTQKALRIPWEHSDMTDVDHRVDDVMDDFYASFRLNESLPKANAEANILPRDRKIKVYTEYEPIRYHLKHPAFVIVNDEDEADVVWSMTHFKDFRKLSDGSPGKFINQFPYESVLTVKDLLTLVCRRVPSARVESGDLDGRPKWFPTAYNLKTELPQFVSCFQRREKRGLDNHWICKPWNLARSLDIYITKNLNCIVRLPMSGPKVACKYVEDPVLLHMDEVGGAVKFDIRYIVLLSSVRPLKVHVYERFWLRFANKPFSLDRLDDYEKHFTVMNYRNTKLKQMFCEDFVKMFEKQYPNVRYEDVERDVDRCLKEVFEAACSPNPPRGIGASPQSRAAYGVDIMLKWDTPPFGPKRVQPVLLEINWAPDCQRACHYYPDFFDDVFSVLFLDDDRGKHVRLL